MSRKKVRKRKGPDPHPNGNGKSTKGVAAYLKACMEEGGSDPTFTAAALGDIARKYGMGKLSKETGLTRGNLYKSLSADGNPKLGTVLRVMKALGVKLTPQAG
ncbi:MAG: addiction module antidote protein [Pseudomonadota bacterium]